MTRTGHIARWNAERGFGFIATPAGEQNIFFHVRDFRGGQPAEGMAVRFEQVEVGGKGPRAVAVQPAATAAPAAARRTPAAAPQRTPSRSSRAHTGLPVWFMLALLAWLGLLAAGTLRGAWPAWLPVALAGLNALTYVTYATDKRAATQGAWRTPESSLHLLALAGGWPAAWWAQQRLRHKSSKAAFQLVYGATVALHLLALLALLWRGPGWLAALS